MATHSSILAWRIPMNRGAWRATVHRVAESDMTEQVNTAHRTGEILVVILKSSFIRQIAKLKGPSICKNNHYTNFLSSSVGSVLSEECFPVLCLPSILCFILNLLNYHFDRKFEGLLIFFFHQISVLRFSQKTVRVILCKLWSLSPRDMQPLYSQCCSAPKSFLYRMSSSSGQKMAPSYSLQLSFMWLFSYQSLISPEHPLRFHTLLLLFSPL